MRGQGNHTSEDEAGRCEGKVITGCIAGASRHATPRRVERSVGWPYCAVVVRAREKEREGEDGWKSEAGSSARTHWQCTCTFVRMRIEQLGYTHTTPPRICKGRKSPSKKSRRRKSASTCALAAADARTVRWAQRPGMFLPSPNVARPCRVPWTGRTAAAAGTTARALARLSVGLPGWVRSLGRARRVALRLRCVAMPSRRLEWVSVVVLCCAVLSCSLDYESSVPHSLIPPTHTSQRTDVDVDAASSHSAPASAPMLTLTLLLVLMLVWLLVLMSQRKTSVVQRMS